LTKALPMGDSPPVAPLRGLGVMVA